VSWDIALFPDYPRSRAIIEENYTFNVNDMLVLATRRAGIEVRTDPRTPLRHLDDLSGPDGAAFLHGIVREMESDPDAYRELNPANGWGDYDSFLALLRRLRNAVPEYPTTWFVA